MSGKPLPWSESCFVCGDGNPVGLGLRFEVDSDGCVVIDPLVIDPRFEGYPGHVHGGVISAALDESAGWACTVRSGSLYFTAELTVRFRRPVPGGRPLLLRAECVEVRRRLARGRSRIVEPGGEILAEAEGRFFPVPAQEAERVIPELKMPGRSATLGDLSPDY